LVKGGCSVQMKIKKSGRSLKLGKSEKGKEDPGHNTNSREGKSYGKRKKRNIGSPRGQEWAGERGGDLKKSGAKNQRG